ncbi:MAG TPA: ABC transporter ATP-binding protein [Burkholderiaceae bacterium]|nr:ABC transporter ATP-binding protein [Burkholderiaceae bacterium]
MNPLLDVRGLHKRFGGVVATDRVDLQLFAGEIHALIGPNGAGKTTLVSQLAGQLPSDGGRIVFDGHDITHLVAHERARRGLVRSFQVTRLFKSFSVLENIALALQAVAGSSLRAWRPVRAETALFEQSRAMLATLGLAAKEHLFVAQLAHGEQRLLEVGIALASGPRLLLLDEPMAGMGPQESGAMEQLIATLRARCTVLLIEHDVDAVFRLADRVGVLVNGRIIASGSPAQVRSDPNVVAAYLGEAAQA